MNDKRDICIFTGAGFSAAIFNQKAQNRFIVDFLNSTESNDFIQYISPKLKTLLLEINNIELVMSHYHNIGYSNLNYYSKLEKKYKRDIIFIRSALAIYFRNKFRNIYSCYDLYNKKLLTDFFNKNKISTENLFVVTTNYDLGFEKILTDIYGSNSYYYPGSIFKYNENQKNKIPILKLHGSVNWMENRGPSSNIRFKTDNRRINKIVDTTALELLTVGPLNQNDAFSLNHPDGNKYTPIVIPFFFQKEIWINSNNELWKTLFKETWDNAYSYLSNANKFYFLGYSLPSADHYLFSYVYNIFINNHTKCNIIDIIDDTVLIKMMKSIYHDNVKDLYIFNDGIINYLQSFQ